MSAVWEARRSNQSQMFWQNEPKIARLATRRTPVEEAPKRIAELLTGDATSKDMPE